MTFGVGKKSVPAVFCPDFHAQAGTAAGGGVAKQRCVWDLRGGDRCAPLHALKGHAGTTQRAKAIIHPATQLLYPPLFLPWRTGLFDAAAHSEVAVANSWTFEPSSNF